MRRLTALPTRRGPNPSGPRRRTAGDWIYVAAPLFDRDLLVVYAEPQASFTRAALSRIWLVLALLLLAAVLSLPAVWFATQRYLLDWFPRLHRLDRADRGWSVRGDRGEFAGAPSEITGMAGDLHTMAAALDRHGRERCRPRWPRRRPSPASLTTACATTCRSSPAC